MQTQAIGANASDWCKRETNGFVRNGGNANSVVLSERNNYFRQQQSTRVLCVKGEGARRKFGIARSRFNHDDEEQRHPHLALIERNNRETGEQEDRSRQHHSVSQHPKRREQQSPGVEAASRVLKNASRGPGVGIREFATAMG